MTRSNPQESPRHPPRAAKPPKSGERLQKFLSRCGIASRRAAEELIVQGRVEINGKVADQLGVRVDPFADEVRLDGERLKMPAKRLLIVLNKPVGFLCAASDPEGRPLVYHLVPKDQALRSIGRLDFNTEGVLLFTNDGDLAERLGHARYAVQRVYEARVRGIPSEETLARLRQGVRLEDGPARAEQVDLVKQTDSNAWLRLTLTEGRNREVRRLLERVGHPVVRLRRVSFAGVTAAGLALGQWKTLEDNEIEQLRTRGHIGAFELPPDPRRKAAKAPGLSTGPGPSDAPQRRGAGRGQAVKKALPIDSLPPPKRPSRGKRPAAPAGRNARGPSLPPPSSRGRKR